MYPCKKCQCFLHDYLHQLSESDVCFSKIANTRKIKENIHELIDAILRSQKTLTDWVLSSVKGEYEMRSNFIKKPETKEEEYLLTYYILKQLGLGFRDQVQQMEELILYLDLVKLKRGDKTDNRKHQFLAILFAPLIYLLDDVHKEHLGIPNVLLEKKRKIIDPEFDLLYS